MTQEEKDLLLKDLCSRLPYGVKVKHEAQDFPSTLLWVDIERLSVGRKADKIGVGSDWGNIEFIKPYLRPISSMTEEENIELTLSGCRINGDGWNGWVQTIDTIDWLNEHHFDFRNLIGRGLAIAVTKENNPYKL